MWKGIKTWINNNLKIFGKFLLVVGSILLTYTGLIGYSITLTNETISLISVLISIDFGFISIGIAFYAIGLSRDSDEKMKAIANANFMEIYEDIQDIFLKLIPIKSDDNLVDNDIRGTFIWKYRNSIMRANSLKDFADERNQLNLVLPLKSFLEKMPWNKNILTNEDIDNILDCYLFIREFKFDKETKDLLEKLIENHMVKRRENEDIVQGIERVRKELSKKPYNIFTKM